MRWEWFVAALLALLVMTNAVMTWLDRERDSARPNHGLIQYRDYREIMGTVRRSVP